MKVLVTGRGVSGSWAIRGEQLGAAIGATVKPMANLDDCRAADLIVAIKKVPADLLNNIRASGRPWVYDIVDAFPQPECTYWSPERSRAWLRDHIKNLSPNAVIWPNERMQKDYGGGGLVVYHHHRPGIAVNPIRESVRKIGYEGSAKFLEGWSRSIDEQCKRRGYQFVVNPDRLADVDIVLAVRGPRWNGYAQQHWKSNVKLANAHGSGTPFIGMPEDGYTETRSGAEYWATDPRQLSTCFDWLESQSAREEVASRFLAASLPIDKIAADYRDGLCGLSF
jgi:hypothetical protein